MVEKEGTPQVNFQKASEIQEEVTEPCHRYGGCKFNGRVAKGGIAWFCEYCEHVDLALGTGEI